MLFKLLNSCKYGYRFRPVPYLLCAAFLININANAAVDLASKGKALVSIGVPAKPSLTEKFAAEELAKYLDKITSAQFKIQSAGSGGIILKTTNTAGNDAFKISTIGNNIVLSGNSGRALLYAVYNFLGKLGCLWLAPDLDIYGGKAEVIPHKTELTYGFLNITQTAKMAYRKIDVDGGRSHNAENLKKMIDWMPKVFYNDLRLPVNMNNNGRVMWDKWRADLLPELQKRGILIEVGGHGYQTFLNAKMEGGTLFQRHPDWFGKDSSCKYVPSERLVFNTANPNAVKYFISNISNYVKQHPEVDIFNLWPPDVGRWADCPEMKALGTPQDRQAALANQVSRALKKIRPGIRTQIIAYSYTLSPPEVKLDSDILVDICPINQAFDKQIYDATASSNTEYATVIQKWHQRLRGGIGLYSYFRKYAWRSAPAVMPHYIQRDLQWYAAIPMNGISTYAEPGDWFTYELNHYILSHLAFQPDANVDELTGQFLKARYGNSSQLAESAYALLEKSVPVYGSLPFTSLKSRESITAAKNRVLLMTKKLTAAHDEAAGEVKENLSRLLLMYQYTAYDLGIQQGRASGAQKAELLEQIKVLVAFMQNNLNKGVFILTGDNDLARFTKKYGLTNQSLLD